MLSTVIIPVVENDGDVPVWVNVRIPLLTVILPLFVCVAEALLMLRDLSSIKDPWLSISTLRLPAEELVWIVPPEEKHANPHAPDIIVGWNVGYRTSWNSILGGMSKEIFSDNLDKWSGDHCVDPSLVPAILISNRKIQETKPALFDLTASVLREFNIPRPNQMIGKSIFDQPT